MEFLVRVSSDKLNWSFFHCSFIFCVLFHHLVTNQLMRWWQHIGDKHHQKFQQPLKQTDNWSLLDQLLSSATDVTWHDAFKEWTCYFNGAFSTTETNIFPHLLEDNKRVKSWSGWHWSPCHSENVWCKTIEIDIPIEAPWDKLSILNTLALISKPFFFKECILMVFSLAVHCVLMVLWNNKMHFHNGQQVKI